MLLLAILMLGSVFLAGCGEGEEPGLDEGTGITDPSGVAGEGENDQEGNTGEEETDLASEGEEVATFSGILKAADNAAGTVTIENEIDGELVLEVNDKSKVFQGDSQITFSDLKDNIGSKVIAEYDD